MQRHTLRESLEVLPFLQKPEIAPETRTETRTVFDVGMNNGDDSAHYLSKGCRVIAVEANPILAQRGRVRFQAEIASGQMVIEALGISHRPEMCLVHLILRELPGEGCRAIRWWSNA